MTTPDFPKINSAIRWTLEYYSIDRIKPHFENFAHSGTGGLNAKLWDDWIDTTLQLHERMEDEINQTIKYCNEYMNVYMFDNLKGWLSDYRIEGVNVELINKEIDLFNDKQYSDFVQKVEEAVKKFQANPNFKREHKEKYEEEITPLWGLVGGLPRHSYKAPKINYKFYVIEERPNSLDITYVNDYCKIVDRIISSFRKAVEKYVEMYEAKRLIFWTNLPLEQQQLLENKQTKLLPEPETSKRITVTLSVPQLAYLFKMLYEVEPGIFLPETTKTDVIRWIVQSITTVAKRGEPISFSALENNMVKEGTEKNVATEWAKRLGRMQEAARNV